MALENVGKQVVSFSQDGKVRCNCLEDKSMTEQTHMIHCHDVLFSAMPHTKSSSLADLLFMAHPEILPSHPEKHPMTIALFLHGNPSSHRRPASHPCCIPSARGQTALHLATENGHAAVVEQMISTGATVDAANNKRRGPGRVFGLSGADEVMEGVLYIGG